MTLPTFVIKNPSLSMVEVCRQCELTMDQVKDKILNNEFPPADFVVFNSQLRWRQSTVNRWKRSRKSETV
jgi:predicted DNA-binding transcriptional regulator AlpA